MGSVVAMFAVVSILAGIVTITAKQLHGVFSSEKPSPDLLQAMLEKWRVELSENRQNLIPLKEKEFDLLAQEPLVDSKLLKSKYRQAGHLQSIYQEKIAQFVYQKFPKAKLKTEIILVQNLDREFVYKTEGEQTFISINKMPEGVLKNRSFYPAGKASAVAKIIPQSDERTVHIDNEKHTLGILLKPGAVNQVVPRAFEFVDFKNEDEKTLLEALSFYYLIKNNIPV